ncbi:MAG TPA: hypothetical protein VL359_07525, partial [bacterium]|nr:hypothetical protein [bacterium]
MDITPQWKLILKDSSGAVIYRKTDLLNPTSTTPYMFTSNNTVFPFAVQPGAELYLSPLSGLFFVALGQADTSFTPDQIATVEFSSTLSIRTTSGIVFIPAAKQL